MDELITFYRNQFTEEEQREIEKLKDPNWKSPMGDMPIKEATTFEMQLYARGWNKYDPLYNDEAYAKTTRYGGMIAFPGYRHPQPMAMLPRVFGFPVMDKETFYVGDAYDHEIQFFAPIYAGDTFTVGQQKNDLVDQTPVEGSTVRTLIMVNEQPMYNQRGELVAKSILRWPQILMKAKDPNSDLERRRMEAFEVHKHDEYRHPIHKYTPEDYERMKKLWAEEKVRGAETLYWEDVDIGDEPTPVCEPPLTALELCRRHAHEIVMEADIRQSLTTGERMMIYAKGTDENGHYISDHHFIGTNGRASLYNFVGRNFVTRLLTNWCGDNGFVSKVGWRFVNDRKPEVQQDPFPEDFYRPSVLHKVPYMKGRFLNTHGQGFDAMIVRGYVYSKYKNENGAFVDLACWCEDFDGNICQECDCTVMLPTKE